MKQELEEKLYSKYPKLFKQSNLPMTQTSMCWGCENGDGWYELIDKMCFSIQTHIEQTRKSIAHIKMHNRVLKQAKNGNSTNLKYRLKKLGVDPYKIDNMISIDIKTGKDIECNLQTPKQPYFVQIKEKFGSLRVYANNLDEYSSGVIRMAENMSAMICEDCGNPGNKYGGTPNNGWIRVRCGSCEANRFKK